MFTARIRRGIAGGALVASAFAVSPSFAQQAQAPAQAGQAPQTIAEHQKRAQVYEKEAAEYRRDAQEHKQMAKEYAAEHPTTTGRGANPFNQKMQKHCMTLAKDYEKLADDAQMAADYHMMRAKEMQGQ